MIKSLIYIPFQTKTKNDQVINTTNYMNVQVKTKIKHCAMSRPCLRLLNCFLVLLMEYVEVGHAQWFVLISWPKRISPDRTIPSILMCAAMEPPSSNPTMSKVWPAHGNPRKPELPGQHQEHTHNGDIGMSCTCLYCLFTCSGKWRKTFSRLHIIHMVIVGTEYHVIHFQTIKDQPVRARISVTPIRNVHRVVRRVYSGLSSNG